MSSIEKPWYGMNGRIENESEVIHDGNRISKIYTDTIMHPVFFSINLNESSEPK